MPSVLVLTGIDGPKQVLAADARAAADFCSGICVSWTSRIRCRLTKRQAERRPHVRVAGARRPLGGNSADDRARAPRIDILRAGTRGGVERGRTDRRGRRRPRPISLLMSQPAKRVRTTHRAPERTPRGGDTNRVRSSRRLRVIEDQPLENRAEALAQVHDELRADLEAGDRRPHA